MTSRNELLIGGEWHKPQLLSTDQRHFAIQREGHRRGTERRFRGETTLRSFGRRWKLWRTITAAVAVGCTVIAPLPVAASTPDSGTGSDSVYAPIDKPGPPLTVPQSTLESSLKCTGDVAPGRQVVLLTPPTFLTADEAYPEYERAFQHRHIPYCTMTVPHYTTIDSQITAEYFVYAVRKIYEMTHNKVVQLGWSQGASMYTRWAYRFFPDVRKRVTSSIEVAPINQGAALCSAVGIVIGTPVIKQCSGPVTPGTSVTDAIKKLPIHGQHKSKLVNTIKESGLAGLSESEFLKAVNSRQRTFPDISYSVIYPDPDVSTTPVNGAKHSAELPPGANVKNVPLKDVCPTHIGPNHFDFPQDPVVFALVMDAVEHPGESVDVKRIDKNKVCSEIAPPNDSAIDFVNNKALTYGEVVERLYTQPQVTHEPNIKRYAYANEK